MNTPLFFLVISYLLATVVLLVHLKTTQKRFFILSMGFVVLVSLSNLLFTPSIITGLLFSAAIFSILGDFFMAKIIKLHPNRIVTGAIAFGLAHIQYIYVLHILSINVPLVLWGIIIIVALLFFFIIVFDKDQTKLLQFIVFCYIFLLVALLSFAINLFIFTDINFIVKILVIVGVLLFIISDSIIGINEFRTKIPQASALIAVTYITSQMLLQAIPLLI